MNNKKINIIIDKKIMLLISAIIIAIFIIIKSFENLNSDVFFAADLNRIYTIEEVEKIQNIHEENKQIFPSIYYGLKKINNKKVIINYVKVDINPEWLDSLDGYNQNSSFVKFNYSFITDDYLLSEDDKRKVNIIAEMINEKRVAIFQQAERENKDEINFFSSNKNETKSLFITLKKNKNNKWDYSIQYQSELSNPNHSLYEHTTISEAKRNFVKFI